MATNESVSFSLLPLEIQEEIASSLSYDEIINLCNSQSFLLDICRDKDFWRGLILNRYSNYSDNPKFKSDPQNLFRLIERLLHRITLTNPSKETFTISTIDEEVIATTIAVASLYYKRNKAVSLVRQLKIIKSNGELLSQKEAISIAGKYSIFPHDYEKFEALQPGIKSILIIFQHKFSCFNSTMFLRGDIRESMLEYILELLHFLEATDIRVHKID